MRVLLVNKSDRGGGAERVAADLLEGLAAAGHQAALAVGKRLGDDPAVLAIPGGEPGWVRWARGLERRGLPGSTRLRRLLSWGRERRLARGREDLVHRGSRRLPPGLGWAPQVIHLHNLHGDYFDLRALPLLARRAPLALTLHDAWPLTGHCAHPLDCPRWRSGCPDCPDLGNPPAVAAPATAFNAAYKRRQLAAGRVRLVAPSAWLAAMADVALPGDHPTRVIYNGVDARRFHPGDQAAARRELGLPIDQPVVFFAAFGGLDNPWKDGPSLVTAVELMAARGVGPHWLVAGGGAEDEKRLLAAGARCTVLPRVTDPERMALLYRAADIYLHPSRADNCPLAVLEAMASGLPVVASAVGGIPELVVPGQTGELAPPGHPQELAQALVRLLAAPAALRDLGRAGRQRVMERFTRERMVAAHLEFYRELIQERGKEG